MKEHYPPTSACLWAQAGKVNLSRRLEGGAGVLLRAAGRPPILPTPALTLQTWTKAAMRLGISPEFSGPFLAPAALGCTLTPPGTAKFSLVLPGQAISSRERESSAEVTRKITHEQGPAPSCFRWLPFVLSLSLSLSLLHETGQFYQVKLHSSKHRSAVQWEFDTSSLHLITLGKLSKQRTAGIPCHDIFITACWLSDYKSFQWENS